MDFKKLVENVLLVEEPTSGASSNTSSTGAAPAAATSTTGTPAPNPNPTSTANQEEVTATNTSGYMLKKYSQLQKDYQQKFPDYQFPVEQDYKGLVYNAAGAAVRNVQDSDRYPTIKDVFPILDLIGLVVQNFGRTEKGDEKTADVLYNDFITKLKTFKGAPLEYQPITQWAKTVKDDYFKSKQKLDIGKLKLESPEFKDKPLYFVIQKLFQLRSISRSNVIKLDQEISKRSTAFIDQFLFNPNTYVSGQKPVPDKQLRQLYNDLTPELLLKVVKSAYLFFEQQANANLDQGTKAFGNNINNVYKLFLQNKINWNAYKTSEQTLETSSVTVFSNAVNRLITEANSPWADAALRSMKPKQPEAKPNPFVDENGVGLYSMGNILQHKEQVPEANALYKALVDLGNTIRKQVESDWSGIFNGIAQLAQGLSMGVPTLGGKRS